MAIKVTWENLDWAALDRLRATFLAGTPTRGAYWESLGDLAVYDFTYAQRIAWKWDAMLGELGRLQWQAPPGVRVLDWGCGSGVASRRAIDFIGVERVAELALHDQSPLAVEFASRRARELFPELKVEHAEGATVSAGAAVDILVLSHVLNELTPEARAGLLRLARRARIILWVEPGTHATSRDLIALREELLPEFAVIAPCTHPCACGMLAAGNERHWCHHFAVPPPGLMGDANWTRFAQRAGIDLRSLPFSYLVLERKDSRMPLPGSLPDGWSRVIGAPRCYKGFAKVFSCQADGVRELMLQKRDDRVVFKDLDRPGTPTLYRWETAGDRIVRAERRDQNDPV
ncbi:MAG TPA: small ribosomal subunit Rsm22 family protein [Verrucomicrobiae bacterium]|nr:small ribosomal subunit Rsm22 family protein [Verrucomicrobiae bacterium]